MYGKLAAFKLCKPPETPVNQQSLLGSDPGGFVLSGERTATWTPTGHQTAMVSKLAPPLGERWKAKPLWQRICHYQYGKTRIFCSIDTLDAGQPVKLCDFEQTFALPPFPAHTTRFPHRSVRRDCQSKFGYVHLLTPQCIAQKAALTSSFLTRKMAEYEALKLEIDLLRAEGAKEQAALAPASKD